MTGAIITIAAILAAFIAAGILIGRYDRRHREQAARERHLDPRLGTPQHWDWPENEWPSPGGWADRERL